MTKTKKARTILCLGPPHSGKSVFCYLLFKSLRKLGNNACVMDGDYYSPTYRRRRIVNLADPDEFDHIHSTSNAQKLNKLKEEAFSRLAHAIHESIEHTGIIVLDGIGKHSYSTESLLELAENLIALCPKSFDAEADSEKCCYMKEDQKLHPFDFYSGIQKKYIKITTHYHNEKTSYFDEVKLEGELFDLDIDTIKKGNIDGIPQETRSTIRKIGKFILDNWV